jgi:hypothetical protein
LEANRLSLPFVVTASKYGCPGIRKYFIVAEHVARPSVVILRTLENPGLWLVTTNAPPTIRILDVMVCPASLKPVNVSPRFIRRDLRPVDAALSTPLSADILKLEVIELRMVS